MKLLFIVLATLNLTTISLKAEPVTFQATTANIAAYNLAGFNPFLDSNAETFANAINDIDPELIALVEIYSDSFIDDLTYKLNSKGACYESKILNQTAPMNIAVVYKCDVEVTNPRLIPGSDNRNPYLRKAFAIDAKIGNFDFILIALHLQAGSGVANRNVRDSQARAIASFIKSETTGDEKDVLVVGDYNMIPVEDQTNFDNMNPDKYLNFVSDKLAGQNSHIKSSGGGSLLDGYAISKDHTGEYIAESIRIIPMHAILNKSLSEYIEEVSDHLPLEAMFRIIKDDD